MKNTNVFIERIIKQTHASFICFTQTNIKREPKKKHFEFYSDLNFSLNHFLVGFSIYL